MEQRQTIVVQHGIWIDRQRLADAGLQDTLEVIVRPGEIMIRSADDAASTRRAADEPLLDVAGVLSGAPVSADDIERQLYDA